MSEQYKLFSLIEDWKILSEAKNLCYKSLGPNYRCKAKDTEEFYGKLQDVINTTFQKDIMIQKLENTVIWNSVQEDFELEYMKTEYYKENHFLPTSASSNKNSWTTNNFETKLATKQKMEQRSIIQSTKSLSSANCGVHHELLQIDRFNFKI